MTEIYLIRHAQAEGNTYRSMQGYWDGKVTQRGKEQIALLAERLKEIPFDAVYSSDLSRTIETAGAITKYHDLTIQTDARLREMHVGRWEQEFFGNLKHYESEKIREFRFSPETWQVEGSENYAIVTKRAMESLEELARRHSGECIAVVSHGITCRCIVAHLTGRGFNGEDGIDVFGNTAVSRLRWEDGVWSVEYYGDCSHLPRNPVNLWTGIADLWDESFDPESAPEVYKLAYADTWQISHGTLAHFSALPYYQMARRHFRQDRRSVLRLYDGETPAALLELDPLRGKDEGYGWISLIYVYESYRHKGYGIQVLARAIRYFTSCGRKTLRLHVAQDNAAAIRFYERWGFREIGREENMLGTLLLMEKTL